MLTVIAIGKLKESYYQAACKEYLKRLTPLCPTTLVELPALRLPDNPGSALIAAALEKEADAVRKVLPKSHWLCVLTPEGKLLSSSALAATLNTVRTGGRSELVFLLGSSYGMADSLKAQADLRLSMSPMTFPHHLARVMVLEQLYRAHTILNGQKYHK